MRNLNIISRLVLAAVLAALILVVYSQSMKWLDLMYSKFRDQAIQGCFEISTEEYTNLETGVKAVVPNRQTYQYCKSEKGL